MQLVTDEVKNFLANSSGIRRMFEAGIELRKKYGADKVYDFSLGNPDLPPPPEVKKSLEKIAADADKPFALGYMPNAGYPEVRAKLAEKISVEQGMEVKASDVVMTCGAAGGINVLFRTILSDGDEVITPSPYFVEYDFYVGNFGGKLVTVPSKDFTFELDVDSLAGAINEKTRALIINSPHNPTGVIYSDEQMAELGRAVKAAEERYQHPIFVVADEPYRFLNYDNMQIPSLFKYFDHSVVVGSFSKTLSLAGGRIGYIAVNPNMADSEELLNGVILCNRILGFVNAPAIAQKILLECLDSQADLDIYRKRREAMAEVLTAAGIEFTMPRGAFYFFVKSPVEDETKFIQALFEQQVLAVPGRAFGRAGYVRFAFCVAESVIRNAAPGIKTAVDSLTSNE